MTIAEIIVLVSLGLIVVEQLGAVAIFAIACLRRVRAAPPDYFPKALVVLPLRGADPKLEDCIRGIAQQSYPDYQVRVVLDNENDRARDVVERVITELSVTHFDVQVLEHPRTTCTLKCSAVYQATENLDPDVEVMATLDSDVVPHPTWLRDLVAPLKDERVGATMGNRWYAPPQGQWGSLVCYAWNAAVVVSMYFNRVPWGGTLAVRTSILRETDLRSRWLRAGCEDVPLFAVLCQIRRKLTFVPSLLMVSREEFGLKSCLRFINRQFLWTRLYHPVAWWSGAVLYTIVAGVLGAATLLTLMALFSGRTVSAGFMALGLAAFLVAELVLLAILEAFVRYLLAPRGELGCKLGPRTLVAVLLAQVLTPLMFVRSLLTRKVEWRGIEYEIRGAWQIRMLEYSPYADKPSTAELKPVEELHVEFPNLASRIFLRHHIGRQFIVPPPPPPALERFLTWYEQRVLKPDLSNIQIDRPIFLVGLHRSGTTLLQDLLCLHPQVGYINNIMPSFPRCFCAAEYLRRRLELNFKGERVLGDSVDVQADSPNEGVALWRRWLHEDHYNLEYVARRVRDFPPEDIAQIHRDIKRVLWCFEGRATRFFCKNPSLLPHLELLAELFPDAKFVHIVRDARTCANSMVKLYRLEQAQLQRIRETGGHGIYDKHPYVAFPRLPRLAEYVNTFGPDNLQTTARLWNDALQEVERVKDRLPDFYEVRYEDFLADPVEQTERILEFCDLPAIPTSNTAFWEKLGTVGQVRHSNQYAGYEIIEEICREKLEQYGYFDQRSYGAAKLQHQVNRAG